MKLWLVVLSLSLLFCSPSIHGTVLSIAAAELEPHSGALLQDNGWVPRVISEALVGSDYQPQFQFLPFRRALMLAQKGGFEVVLPLYISAERKTSLLFSAPLGISQTVLFYRKAKPLTFETVADLKGLSVAIMRGARVSDEFDNASHFKRVEVTSYQQQVSMLMLGRVDALVGEEFIVRAVIARNQKPVAELLQAESALATQGIYAAVSKAVPDADAKIAAINLGLEKIKASGVYASILADYNIAYEEGMLRQLVKSD